MEIPQFERRVACIASDPAMAAVVSSYFNERNTYFATFYAPRLWLHEFEPGRKTKAISMIDPDIVIMAGLSREEINSMKPMLRGYGVIKINKLEQIKRKLKFLRIKFKGELKCKQEDMAIGLLYAKRNKLLLVPDESTEPLNIDMSHGTDLIALESEGDLSDVITANYAFAFNTGLQMLEKVNREQIESIQEQFSEINKHLLSDPKKAKSILNDVEQVIIDRGEVNLENYKSATFVTRGIPYGLKFRDNCPVCHIYRYPDLGRFIVNNIWWEHHHSFLGIGVVFAPQRFNEDETFDEIDFVLKKLSDDCHYYAISLEEEKATVESFDNFVQFFPMELLHICAHGGESGGYRCKYVFIDPEDESKHEMLIDQVITAKPHMAKPDKDGMIRVGTKSVFKTATFDGIPWKESDFKKYSAELRMAIMRESEPIERTPIDYVPQSNQIYCHDGTSFGMYPLTDLNPIIFNNSCCSTYELADTLIFAGSRCYIGTCWSVSTPNPATYVACAFYDQIMAKPLLQSFWEALELHLNPDDPLEWKNYLYFGTHFSTLRPTAIRPKEPLIPLLKEKIKTWKCRAKQKHISDDWRQDCERIALFLSNQLQQFEKAYEQMQPIVNGIMPVYNTMMITRGELRQDSALKAELNDDLLKTSHNLLSALQ